MDIEIVNSPGINGGEWEIAIVRNHEFVLDECYCGNKPTLYREHDDTPGFKETFFVVKCECGECADNSEDICKAAKYWNQHIQGAIKMKFTNFPF